VSDDVVSDIQREYLKDLAEQGRRFDGRDFDEYRDVTLETDLIRPAEGSARIQLGDTEVYCGVKMQLGDPYDDSPNQGVITTNAELNPIAAPDFESGPPRPPAVEVARVVDRGIRESEALPLEELVIEPGESCWVVYLDAHVVDYDGNLFDAASLGFLAALNTAEVPYHEVEDGRDPEPLELQDQPVMTTAAKVGGELLFDPTAKEETVAEPRMSVSVDENGRVRAAQKGLSGGFTPDEVQTVINESRVKADELRAVLMDHLKTE
jgi:exosome complex component RRP42